MVVSSAFKPTSVEISGLGEAAVAMARGVARAKASTRSSERGLGVTLHCVIRNANAGGPASANLMVSSKQTRANWLEIARSASFLEDVRYITDARIVGLAGMRHDTTIDFTSGGAWVEWCAVMHSVEPSALLNGKDVIRSSLLAHSVLVVAKPDQPAEMIDQPFKMACGLASPVPGWCLSHDETALIEANAAPPQIFRSPT